VSGDANLPTVTHCFPKLLDLIHPQPRPPPISRRPIATLLTTPADGRQPAHPLITVLTENLPWA